MPLFTLGPFPLSYAWSHSHHFIGFCLKRTNSKVFRSGNLSKGFRRQP